MLAIQLAYWGLVSFPLVVGGTILGRVWSGQKKAPCRVNNLPRPIPPRRWVSHPVVIAAVSGILPFGSIFIEMYFVFTSFWNYKFYYVYGFMLLVYVILIIVSSCVTVVAMYFLLNAEGGCLGVLALARMLNLAHWCRVCVVGCRLPVALGVVLLRGLHRHLRLLVLDLLLLLQDLVRHVHVPFCCRGVQRSHRWFDGSG